MRLSLRRLAACLALLAAAAAAPAQTAGKLVGNTGQTGTQGNHSGGLDAAQSFTTGSDAAGYRLTRVDILMQHENRTVPTYSVSIHSNSSGSPGTSLGVLTNPASLPESFALARYGAPSGGIELQANTTYWVVVDITANPNSTLSFLRVTHANGEDSDGATGWSIGDNYSYKNATGGSWTSFHTSLILAIHGCTGPCPVPEAAPRDPEPPQLALWTDKPGYRPGETVRLYRTVDPHDDKGRYRTFAYLERAGGGERRYLAPLTAAGELRPEPVDRRGMPAGLASPAALAADDRTLSWQGEAPAPGLWQFVLELRPGAPEEQFEESEQPFGTRRAWAKFRVAQRSQLLNRRGFDREVRNDLTLRSDTIHYLGHQLFVHDGATLTIEPGTLVRAWGRHAAIIVEPGGRIVAEGTREAPVVLTCSAPAGQREPGCWGGLRILGRAPVTRLAGVAPGVLPAARAAYGGADAEGSSGVLRYVRVEFAGAGAEAEAALPAIGLYGAGSGTVLDHVQARASLGDGFAFHGGTAVCDHCVASGSLHAGLSWQRGWRGAAAHLYVQHGSRGLDGLVGGNDKQGHDREPRSRPALSNVTLVHAWPYGRRERKALALRLATGSGVTARDLLATRFLGGAIDADGRSGLLFGEGESSVSGALLYLNGVGQLKGGVKDAVEFISEDPKLRDVRDFPNPDPRPKANSPALTDEGEGYIGAFGETENWLEEWTVFGPESVYDLQSTADSP